MQVVKPESDIDPKVLFEDFDAWARTHMQMCKRCNYAYNVAGDIAEACGQTQRKLGGIIKDLEGLGYSIEYEGAEPPQVAAPTVATALTEDDPGLD